MEIATVSSMTSGHPLIAVVVRRSKIRAFFGMSSVLLNVYSQGLMSTEWRWHLCWFKPSEINWSQSGKLEGSADE